MYNEAMNIKDHICPSCGGTLHVDIARQMYECPFCGLSFDFDIIRDETAVAEAQDALSKQQFLKADAIYKYILTVDPKNFAALRGRILCAAKWPDLGTTIQYAEYYMEKAHIPSLKLRIEEALGACEECDRPFVYAVIDKASMAPVFIGTVNEI